MEKGDTAWSEHPLRSPDGEAPFIAGLHLSQMKGLLVGWGTVALALRSQSGSSLLRSKQGPGGRKAPLGQGSAYRDLSGCTDYSRSVSALWLAGAPLRPSPSRWAQSERNIWEAGSQDTLTVAEKWQMTGWEDRRTLNAQLSGAI